MKVRPKALITIIPLIQVALFYGSWSLAVWFARSLGRFPEELSFGITTFYGFIGVSLAFIICSIVAYYRKATRYRVITIALALALWGIWLWPSLNSRPLAISVFFTLGAVLLVLGSGFIIPLLKPDKPKISSD